jgi:hypothetical protein
MRLFRKEERELCLPLIPLLIEYILNRGLLFLIIDSIYRAFSVDMNYKSTGTWPFSVTELIWGILISVQIDTYGVK